MKILVINQPLANRGDESAHRALLRRISSDFNNSTIDVLFVGTNEKHINEIKVVAHNINYINIKSKPKRGYSFLTKLAFKINSIFPLYFNTASRKQLKTIKSYDLIVNAPGGISMGAFLNIYHVENLLIAKHFNKPIAYYGRSVGPFLTENKEQQIFKNRSYEVMRYFSFFSLRDSKSIALMNDSGIPYTLTVDTAFIDSPKVSIPKEIQLSLKGKDYIVFVPNKLTWQYAYKTIPQTRIDGFYLEIIDIIKNKWPSHKIVMLPQTDKDRQYFVDLTSSLNDKDIVIIDDIYGSDLQQTIIAGSRCVIGARYHSIVFAINNGVSFVSLSYEHKMVGLLEILGDTENMVDITKTFYDEESVLNTLNKLKNILSHNIPMSNIGALKNKAESIAERSYQEFVEYVKKISN